MNEFVIHQPRLTTAAIQTMMNAAVAQAVDLGVAVNIAIADNQSQLVAFLQMCGAHVGAKEIAMDKAWTSVSFGGRSTKDIGIWLTGLPDLTRDALLARPRYTALTGGMPIHVDGILVGSIGVAGAMPDQDEECGLAALRAINKAHPA